MSDQAQDDLVFWQYLFGTLGLGVLCCVNGEFLAGIRWLQHIEPGFALGLMGFYGLQLIGVQAILEIVQLFDATMAQVVSSVRRICTFVLSFFVFPKPFGVSHAVGTVRREWGEPPLCIHIYFLMPSCFVSFSLSLVQINVLSDLMYTYPLVFMTAFVFRVSCDALFRFVRVFHISRLFVEVLVIGCAYLLERSRSHSHSYNKVAGGVGGGGGGFSKRAK